MQVWPETDGALRIGRCEAVTDTGRIGRIMQPSGNVELTTRIGPGFGTTPTFEAMVFPAGEAHIKVVNENWGKGPLTEVCRLYGADGNDLFTVAMWADACRRRADARRSEAPDSKPNRMVLLLPYLPGARADHAEFVPFGAGVYADFVNSLGVDQVICFDPHSPVMPGLLNEATVIDSTRLFRRHIVGRADQDSRPQRYSGIIAPDKGATERARKVADACHLPMYQALKHRNPETGRLSEFTCEPLPDTGRFLVVDDICDGGGTFMGLAQATGLPKERLGLYVSHGVFSGNAEQLVDHYAEVWTTDSLQPNPAATSQLLKPHVIPLATTLNGYIR
ncbi:ribose-phosphate pyrophosphokinase [Microbacterium enclense]|uniref:ribose-phosphate pyrophosphokinase n=1 Tax=Microbacterium enclense TaxID=993073 RepID=UPI003F7FD67D